MNHCLPWKTSRKFRISRDLTGVNEVSESGKCPIGLLAADIDAKNKLAGKEFQHTRNLRTIFREEMSPRCGLIAKPIEEFFLPFHLTHPQLRCWQAPSGAPDNRPEQGA